MLGDACPDHRPSQPQLVFLKRTFVFTGRADWNIIHLSVTHTGYMVGAKLQATLPLPNLALRAKPESGDIVFEHFGIMKRAADSWALLSPYKVDGGECVGKRPLPLGKFCCYWKKTKTQQRPFWVDFLSLSEQSQRVVIFYIFNIVIFTHLYSSECLSIRFVFTCIDPTVSTWAQCNCISCNKTSNMKMQMESEMCLLL